MKHFKSYNNLFVLEDNNPDVVPQETSEGEYISEEKAFDRLNSPGCNQRDLYKTHTNCTIPSPTSQFSSSKPISELSLTTNPAFALYNSPQRRPPTSLYHIPQLQPDGAFDARVNSNIYTRIPTRPFSPVANRKSPVSSSAYSSSTTVTTPFLFRHYQETASNLNFDDNS